MKLRAGKYRANQINHSTFVQATENGIFPLYYYVFHLYHRCVRFFFLLQTDRLYCGGKKMFRDARMNVVYFKKRNHSAILFL